MRKRLGQPGRPTFIQTPSFWIDESGSKSSAGRFFVLAAIKTRHPDLLQRELFAIRESHGMFDGEFKFGRINRRTYQVACEIVDALEASDALLAATVDEYSQGNPFAERSDWMVRAEIISSLLVGNINKNEVATVFMDSVSTPRGVALGALVKRSANAVLGSSTVVTAVSLDSRSSDLLQAADLVAGAVRYTRMLGGPESQAGRPKYQVSRRLAAAFGVDTFEDQRTRRLNIATVRL